MYILSSLIYYQLHSHSGLGGVVSIATGYGLDGPGIESPVGARFSAPVQTGPGAHPASYTRDPGSFPGGKERPVHDADPSPPSSAVVMKGKSYTSTSCMGRTACTEPQCLYKDALFTVINMSAISSFFHTCSPNHF
jgi:hypothetical protein